MPTIPPQLPSPQGRDRAVAIDLTRLITRLKHASPTGIDRVDLAYARHLLSQDGPRFGLVSTALGPRLLDRSQAVTVVERVVAGWIEDVGADEDPVYRDLAARLGAPGGEGATGQRGASGRRPASGRNRAFVETEFLTLRAPDARTHLPHGALYLHTSHLRLDRPARFDWLYDRRDVAPVFFVHDIIPIDYPEYGRPGEAARHAVRMLTVARHARAVIVNSADVGARVAAHWSDLGLPVPPTTVAWLGSEPAFADPAAGALAAREPVFVACSTIEPRKNYHFLLTLWREMALRHGPATPRLVIVGRRGWESENVIDLLDRSPGVRAHVSEVSGLSTAGLVRLLRGARALLMPSFAEGYGLPVVEAAAAGLPVVASDIPVHREIGQGFARFLDPLDGPGWTRAVEALAAPDSPERAAMAQRLTGYAPPTWEAHFARVDEAIAALA